MDNQELIKKIIAQLGFIYPQGDIAFNTDEKLLGYIEQLEMGLVENNLLTPNLIKNGFKKMRARDSAFYPSVGEFIAACEPKPEDFGEPSADEAYLMAGRVASSEQKHDLPKCVYWAAKGIWKQVGEAKLEREYKKRYLNLFSDAVKGLIELDDIPQALERRPFKRQTEADKQQGQKVLSELLGKVEE